ncbi:MAG TPA: recombinase family protein [Armatimonadota bacterium]|jgi:DNA invertase Pin-like site-specific DNA recombinase/DNA-binding CsgD family transcriptional regulator
MKIDLTPPRDGSVYRVGAYVRVSVDDERNGSHTFETQRARITEKLDRIYGKGNYVADEFIDNGLSGGYGPEPTGSEKRTRPGFKKFETALKTGAYDAMIVYDLSRFTRTPRWLEVFIDDVVEPFGIRFISAREDVDLATTEGRSMARFLTLGNTMFREGLKKRIQDAVDTRTSQGFLHGNPGYGWAWEPIQNVPIKGRRRIIRNEEQGRWVIQIKDWALAGWGTVRIADELNRLGVRTPSGNGVWAFGSARNILDSVHHAGYIKPRRGELTRGDHFDRRYYDLEDYERIQAVRPKRGVHKRTPHAASELLNGVATCARCGTRLYISLSRKSAYHSYRCITKDERGNKTCPKVTVRGESLEALVIGQLEEFAGSPDFNDTIDREAARSATEEEQRNIDRRAHVQRELEGISVQFSRWANMVTRELITENQFAEFNVELGSKQSALNAELSDIEKALSDRTSREQTLVRVRKAVADFPAVWRHLNPDERRGMIALLVERLFVDRDGDTATVTFKMACLPEVVLPMSAVPPPRSRPTGVETLTLRQLAILQHLRMGKTPSEAADAMGVTYGCVQITLRLIRKHLGYHEFKDLIEVATPKLNEMLPFLPMGPSEKRDPGTVPTLTEAEGQVFRPLAAGATSKEVARLTGFPKKKVDGHRANILRKLGAKTIFEASQKARPLGLLA